MRFDRILDSSSSGAHATRGIRFLQIACGAFLICTLAGQALAAVDAGDFIVRLGRDTTSVEHYSRTPARIEVNQVGRAPRVLQRHFIYDFKDGVLSHLSMVVTPPGSSTPTQAIDATFGADSMRMKVQTGTAPVQNTTLAIPPGTVVVANTSPWVAYESQMMKLVESKHDSLRSPLWFLAAPNTNLVTVSKLGRDSVTLATDRGDLYHVQVDATGHILAVRPIAGTAKFSVQRVTGLDLEAMTTAYTAREKAGTGLGMLSPRDTVRAADVGGASLMIDYGRPAKRGRVVFGDVVPYGEVWRTGANAATQFKTDKALVFGVTTVPAGFYTLWTVPNPKGWKLIVNSETGQWGTAHKPEKDLYTIDMQVIELPQSVERFTIGVDPTKQGGVLHFDWDMTRVSTAFVVQQ